VLIKNIGFIIAGFVGLGAILGAIDDAESQLSMVGSVVLSVIILGVWVAVERYIKRQPLEWWGSNVTKFKVKKLSNGIRR